MERHRLVWLHLDRHPEMLPWQAQILHVAPENVLRDRFQAVHGVRYHGGDLTAEFGPERIDVTDIDLPDESMDVVVCNHVLEHVPDDRRAMAEIRRVLKPDGWALLLVPGLEGSSGNLTTDEDPSVISPKERLERFGQADHVRMYGWDYLDRLRKAGLDPEVVDPATQFSSEVIGQARLASPRGLEPLLFARPAKG